MVTRVITNSKGIDMLATFLGARNLPVTVTVTAGAGRKPLQNRLAQRWFTDISRQLGDQTHEEVRAYCKLHFGVPILRAENEAFRQVYDRIIRPRPYAEKLEAVQIMDLPVTRLMTVKQMTQFMDVMQRHWSGMGFRLTDPEALKYEEEMQ